MPALDSEERLQCSFPFLKPAPTHVASDSSTSVSQFSDYVDKTRSHLLKHFCHNLAPSPPPPSILRSLSNPTLTAPILPDPSNQKPTLASQNTALPTTEAPSLHFPWLNLSTRQIQILTPIFSFLLIVFVFLFWSCYLSHRYRYLGERRRLQHMAQLSSQQRQQQQVPLVLIRTDTPIPEALVTRPLPAAISKTNLWDRISSAKSRWTRDAERTSEREAGERVHLSGVRPWRDVEGRDLPPRYESLDGLPMH